MTDSELIARMEASFGSGPWEAGHVQLLHEAAARMRRLGKEIDEAYDKGFTNGYVTARNAYYRE